MCPILPLLVQRIEGQVDRAKKGTDRNAHNGPHSSPFAGIVPLKDIHRQPHAHSHLRDGLNGLGNRGGHHVGAPLEIPPQGGHDGNEKHCGRKGHYGIQSVRIPVKPRDLPGTKKHEKAACDANEKKQPKGHGKHAIRFLFPALRISCAHHAGNSDGKPGGGEHQKYGKHIIGRIKIGHALRIDQVRQGNGEQKAQYFYDQGGGGQNCRPFHKALLFLLRHTLSQCRKFHL